MMATSKKIIFFGILLIVVIISLATVITLLLVKKSDGDEKENESYDGPVWGYKCEDFICKRVEMSKANVNETSCLNVCRMTCGENIGTLWPMPSGNVQFSSKIAAINPNQITVQTENFKTERIYWQAAWQRFREMQYKKIPFDVDIKSGKSIFIEILSESDDMTFNYDTFEGYKLRVYENSDEIYVYVSAKNFYGTRHAIETLSQLIVYDEFEETLVILSNVEIEDEPAFKHRGISMDTSRTFYPLDAIKRTIEGLAMVKLNTFHWHITDSQSFPLELKSHPEITRLGAYSSDKIYRASEIEEVIEFAKSRGVRVIPEFDTPQHVGEGWQNTGFVICYKDASSSAQWRGHFDPTQDELYNVLEDIYREIVETFKPSLFHIGNDEINVDCWNSSESIRNWLAARGMQPSNENFMNLWDYYLKSSTERLNRVLDSKVPLIIWTSTLTEEPYLTQFLDKNRHIIQIWLDSDDENIKTILENGFKIIVSNSDALYLDCGVGMWVNEGLNWCSPYKTWQRIYENKLEKIAGGYIDQVLGSEAAIWSESIDETILDMRIWPRASAMAERLWSNPQTSWTKAEGRLLMNRKRLVEIGGLAAESLQLEWCVQNEGECPS